MKMDNYWFWLWRIKCGIYIIKVLKLAVQRLKPKTAALFTGLLILVLQVPIFAQDLQWAIQIGGTGLDQGLAIATDSEGNVYVTGTFADLVVFGKGQASEITLTSAGSTDIFAAKFTTLGELIWAKRAGGSTIDHGQDIVVQNSGSVYIAGIFQSSATFGSGELNETTLTSFGNTDIFVAKLKNDGELDWVKQAGGTDGMDQEGLAVDSDGNVYLSGAFFHPAIFGSGDPNETMLNGVDSESASNDAFLAKYASDGEFIWVKQTGGSGSDHGTDVASDEAGNIYAIGYFSTPGTIGIGEPTETTIPKSFVARFSNDGELAWAKDILGSSVGPRNIVVDRFGDIFLTGEFAGSVTFAAGEINEITFTAPGNVITNIFIAKYDSVGVLMWAKRIGGLVGGLGQTFSPSIDVDSSGSSFLTGGFHGSVIFGPGEINETSLEPFDDQSDIFVAKYIVDGTFSWVVRNGSSNSDLGKGIAVDLSGSILATGHFRELSTFGINNVNETTLTSAGGPDIFVARFLNNEQFGLVFRVERSTGDVFADGSFIPDGADMAERINVSEPVEPGDVVELDPTVTRILS
ncbi:SBBP repeat-containing protein [candidate division KSB1 bacterium]|nr:SBBP repeat-containing protein [candidate division KSB1 bacterium]